MEIVIDKVSNNVNGIKIYFYRCLFLNSTTASFLTESVAIVSLLCLLGVANLDLHST